MENRNASNVFMTLFIQNNNEVRLASSTISYLAQIESFFEFFYADDLARVQIYWFLLKQKHPSFTRKLLMIARLPSRLSFPKSTHGWTDMVTRSGYILKTS